MLRSTIKNAFVLMCLVSDSPTSIDWIGIRKHKSYFSGDKGRPWQVYRQCLFPSNESKWAVKYTRTWVGALWWWVLCQTGILRVVNWIVIPIQNKIASIKYHKQMRKSIAERAEWLKNRPDPYGVRD